MRKGAAACAGSCICRFDVLPSGEQTWRMTTFSVPSWPGLARPSRRTHS